MLESCRINIKLIMVFETEHRGPFHKRFSHRNSHSMENSFYSHPSCSNVIAMKFCAWHHNCAVMARAKVCNDMIRHNGVTLNRFLSNLNYDRKLGREMGPWIMMPHHFSNVTCCDKHSLHRCVLSFWDLISFSLNILKPE